MSNLRSGMIIKHNNTGERFKITNVFHKNRSVHCREIFSDGSLASQRKVTGLTFEQIEESMTIQ